MGIGILTPGKWDALYTALGDSLASGMGPIILGYPYHYRDWLKSSDGPYPGKRVKMINLARYGWSSHELLKALVDSRLHREAVRIADVITLDVGGNDLLYRRRSEKELEDALNTFAVNLEKILSEIRELNGGAQVYLMDIYNPFSDPGDAKSYERDFSGADSLHPCLEIRLQALRYIPRLNQVIHSVAKDPSLDVSGIACVYERFLGCESKFTLMNTIFRDIHPNHFGQKAIASCFISVSKLYQMKGNRKN